MDHVPSDSSYPTAPYEQRATDTKGAPQQPDMNQTYASHPGPPPPGFTQYPPPMGVPAPGPSPPYQDQYYGAPPVMIVQGQPVSSGGQHPPSNPGLEACAIVGLIFSWIPIIGWINFCVHVSAPAGSRRRKYGSISLIVATVVFILNVIIIAVKRNNSSTSN